MELWITLTSRRFIMEIKLPPWARWDEEKESVRDPHSHFSVYNYTGHTYYTHNPEITDLCRVLGLKRSYSDEGDAEHPYWMESHAAVRDGKGQYDPYRGICPMMKYSISFIDEAESFTKGEYPQSLVDKRLSSELEHLLENGKLRTTSKQYTFNGSEDHDCFKPEQYQEYAYAGQKYIRVLARPCEEGRFEPGEVCWIKVQPIDWKKMDLLDLNYCKSSEVVSKAVLVAGIPPQFVQTYLKKYLSKEMEPSKIPQRERGMSGQLEKFTEDREKKAEAIHAARRKRDEAKKERDWKIAEANAEYQRESKDYTDLQTEFRLKKEIAGKDRKGLRQLLGSASKVQKTLLIKQLTTDTPERLAEFEKAKKIRKQRLDSIKAERKAATDSKKTRSRIDKLQQDLKTTQKAHDSARETRKQAEQEFRAYLAKRKSEHT